jgi:hypothetical protein
MVEGHVPVRGWGFKSPFAHWRRHRQAIVRSAASGVLPIAAGVTLIPTATAAILPLTVPGR